MLHCSAALLPSFTPVSQAYCLTVLLPHSGLLIVSLPLYLRFKLIPVSLAYLPHTAPLHHSITAKCSHCPTVVLSQGPTAPLSHCPISHYLTTPLYHCPSVTQSQSPIASLPHFPLLFRCTCPFASLPNSQNASLSYYLTVPIFQVLLTPCPILF